MFLFVVTFVPMKYYVPRADRIAAGVEFFAKFYTLADAINYES